MQAAMKQRTSDLSEMYILSQPRRADVPASASPTLDDLAHVALRALDATVALIVLDGAARHLPMRRAGVAAVAGDILTQRDGNAGLAALVDPVVADANGFAFYAATPLRDDYGVRIGTLAVLGRSGRTVSDDDLAVFRKLAGIVERFV